MQRWLPGWADTSPQPGDGVLAMSNGVIQKPADGWLMEWSDVNALLGAEEEPVFVGRLDDRAVYVCGLDADRAPGELEALTLRDALLSGERVPAEMLGLAHQVQQWWFDHRFCGRCGAHTSLHPVERARRCEPCGVSWYPRLSPCVIVMIRRQDRLLLARSSRVKRNFFSLIAGFVEAGETLEEAVRREVKEETGLDVANIRYHASQSWPFPSQLMLGFFADYAGGELVLQEDEIAEADWFLPDELPPVPPTTTIAGRLIGAMQREIKG
ncbi:NAD(+) diphosphatase [Marinobacter zhejiangensis]|uniref:NAD(+) diphosphatase n=1 Tax=Marinobacter zhejiangensis TaxID=488535 RepID=A0A1I4NA46_9GAMM|nr:NAD(+) diphosphatase [Marinobacter zhejiangensis]SFM12414.1 NAD+ diphosphatase [Marinobacter zhejiangensis]